MVSKPINRGNAPESTNGQSSIWTAAQKLYKRGLWVVPTLRGEKKKPLVTGYGQTRLSLETLRTYLEAGHNNIAIELSHSPYIDIECDSVEADALLFEWFRDAKVPFPPNTPTWKSSRGYHRLFKRPKGLPEKAMLDINGIEFLIGNKTKLTTVPPSIHASGCVYEWVAGKSLFDLEPAELPAAIVARLKRLTSKPQPATGTTDALILANGSRNNDLTAIAGGMRRLGASFEAIHAALQADNVARCEEPLPDHEVRAIAESVGSYAPTDPKVRARTLRQSASRRSAEVQKCRTVEVQSFPVDVLPPPLANYIREASKALPCPPDFLAIPMLSILGTAIGNSVSLVLKDGWREYPRIYTALIARPGDKKSPALDTVMQPLYAIQKDLHAEYHAAVKAYEEAEAPKPDRPIPRQIVTTDATIESLIDVLTSNPRGILFCQDELSAWTRSLGQYKGGRGNDRQHWLSFWSGSPITVNRKGKPPLYCNHPFVSVTGCTQPDMLGELADRNGREDGFINRVLFSYPDPIPLTWSESTVHKDTTAAYATLVNSLWQWGQPTDTHARLTLSPAAKSEWVRWIGEHLKETEACDQRLRGAWSKLDGYCGRLALILHRCSLLVGTTRNTDVDANSVKGAIELIGYFKSHAHRVYDRMKQDGDTSRIGKALHWIKSRGGKVTVRDVLIYKVTGVSDAEEAESLLQDLADEGHGTITRPAKNRMEFTLTKP